MGSTESLISTPLHDLHLSLGGKMVGFAGYSLPVQYEAGVLKEHLHTRNGAGLFDVSHMGQIRIRARSGDQPGDLADVARALETLMPADAQGLAVNRQRYGLFTNSTGGILDDLMFANRDDHFYLVVNAACKAADLARLEANLSSDCIVEAVGDRALLALQGPKAEEALAMLAPGCAEMRFMDVETLNLNGCECYVSRSGYTGEDGFEISVPEADAAALAQALLKHDAVEPAGLGARDSLRLEAGLCLYGSDLDATITPVEAGLEWSIQKSRRRGGRMAGGFPGEDVILDQLVSGATRRRVGLRPDGRAPVRAGAQLYEDETATNTIGVVTSGGFGPSVGHPISMAYIETAQSAPGTRLFAEVRGKRLAVDVAPLPFITAQYKRNPSRG
jgi:aminomethyltransferase